MALRLFELEGFSEVELIELIGDGVYGFNDPSAIAEHIDNCRRAYRSE